MTRHDDQGHSRGKDADHAGLQGEIEQVSRGEKDSVGQDVEGNPEAGQYADHAEKVRVDSDGGGEPLERIHPRCRDCGARGPVGHRIVVPNGVGGAGVEDGRPQPAVLPEVSRPSAGLLACRRRVLGDALAE